MNLKSRTAIVTGAASGIGRGIAVSLAKRGCNLALADLDEAGLIETERMTSSAGAKASRHRLDVSDRQAVAAFPKEILGAHAGVDLLVNNAGVALEEIAEEDFEWLFGINFWGVVRMTRAFLPLLRTSDDARIVNISSVFGLIAPAGQTAYAASKFAVRSFSNALMNELEGSNVGVTVVHPGGVATAIAGNARWPKSTNPDAIAVKLAVAKRALTLPPERAGEIIVEGIERRAKRVLVGRDAKMIALVERLAPVNHLATLKRLTGAT
ncbi:MAG: SDR family oxidoreductase [Roseiarcus sp.]|uniref:SDR family NAD(P)-dependent oxidoreductase n=1 Tax=Roseiarcus sp. TaxID=1969460 RepID=UPI003C54988B